MKPADWRCPKFSGPLLRATREEANLSQAALAIKAQDMLPTDGPKVSQVGAYELGKVQPTINAMMAICAVLGCRVEDLCEGGELQ